MQGQAERAGSLKLPETSGIKAELPRLAYEARGNAREPDGGNAGTPEGFRLIP